LSPQTAAFLRERLYPEASVNNPIDVLATAGPEHFAAAIQALQDDPNIDAIFLNFVTPFFVDTLGVAREIAAANKRSRKPMVATVMTEKKTWAETLQTIRAAGIPTYDMPETGARVLIAMGRYAAFLQRPIEKPTTLSGVKTDRAGAIVAAARRAGRGLLSAADGFALLSCYGIPVALFRSAANVEQCLAAADELGYPVVLKVDAEAVVHKTDQGGVVLNIASSGALRDAAERLAAQFAAARPRFLIQEQLPAGREVIVGAKAIERLGHLLMLGLGGIHAEVLHDVGFKLAPVTADEARGLIMGLHGAPLLTGVRGQPGVDCDALVEIIQRVSQMLTVHPEIRELDINPIFAHEHGAVAADVRIALAGGTPIPPHHQSPSSSEGHG
jgi:acyl-CoA synthetase (NDP forming)